DLAEPLITDNTRYLITPETFTFNFDLDSPEMNSTYQNVGRFLERHPNVNVILGALSYKFYMNKRQATPTARLVANGVWYDHYNTALMIDRNGLRNWYHKSKLVPGVEIVPYQQQLKFLGAIFDKFGGATGSYARSERVENLSTADGAQVGAMICYESIYGDWFRHCADLGAGFVTVITNDGWWGDTPGYRQHFRFASLRAIENRRDVVHVANTGITGFIDQRGDVVQRTGWWEPVAIKGVVNLNQQKTFYTINGDMTGRICTMLFLLLLIVYVSRALMLAIESKPVKKKK
ncbi:MAG: apolipoprotein N-acyltransferase, partial [Bacteroidales bacterium]|nr:apolipoprotein N-acyltransferase [Bacteroidales bacterium]